MRHLARLAGLALAAGALLAPPAWSQAVSVRSLPIGAQVEIDGEDVGPSPALHPVLPGRRTVRVRKAGYADWHREVGVAAGDTVQVEALLERLTGSVAVVGLPDGAVVIAGGRPVDSLLTVGEGFASLTVRVPGQPDAQRRVPVVEGQVTRVAYVPRQLSPVWIVTSVAAPGVVQVSGRRPLAGALVLTGLAASAAVALGADARMRDANAGYDAAVASYDRAASEAEVSRARAQAESHIARARDLRGTRRLAMGAGAAVYLAGVADALWHHAFRPGLRASASPVSARVSGAGATVSFRLSR